MNKVCAIVMLILALVIGRITFDNNDDNLNVARGILCEKALLSGDLQTFKAQNNRISNQHLKFANFDYINIKKAILTKQYDSATVESEIAKVADFGQRAVLWALLATNEYKKGNINKYNNYIVRSYSDIKSENPVVAEQYCYEIVENLVNLDEKLPQEHAVDFVQIPYYSNTQVLHILGMGGKRFCVQKISRLLNDKQFVAENKRFVRYMQRAVFISKIKDASDADINRWFLYSAIEFSMTWKIRNWNNYKLPLLAYACYVGGDLERYKFYRDKSVSAQQLKDMSASYFGYVEYAAKIFCLTNDTKLAQKLLGTLPDGHPKNLVIKNLLRFFEPIPTTLIEN